MASVLSAMAGRSARRLTVAMFEVRIHGRGGQDVVTVAEMLALAAFDEVAARRRSPASAPSAWAGC